MVPSELSPTARVLLGMLSLGMNTGYDIKQLADKSTRHFWQISYGQIYPELRRLEEQGLVAGREEPSGGRARTVYALTAAGAEALRGWLRQTGELVFEQRCETMLKLFFSDAAEPELRAAHIRVFRQVTERKLAGLLELQQVAETMPDGPRLTLDFGVAQMQFMVDWCRRTEARLSAQPAEPEGSHA
jgi:PadR family transcriptional regulator AphA